MVSPSFGYGGANIIAAKMGQTLNDSHNIIYYSYNYRDNYSDLPQDKLFFYEGSQHKILNKVGKGIEYIVRKREFIPYRYYGGEIKRLYQLIEDFEVDCVILNSFIAVSIFAIPLRSKYPDIKQIAWMHESVEHSFGSLAKNYLTTYKNSLKTVDSIVCLTKTDLDMFMQYNPQSMVIHNPVTFSSGRKSSLNKKVISFTSRLDIEIKGLDYLIKLAKMIPKDWKIRVAANGTKNQINDFVQLIEQNDVQDIIEFVGALKGEELIEHYLNSSIFISTSRIESFQLVLIEAMECGLPVISFKHSGAKEILDNGKYGILIDNYNVEEMSKKVAMLCNSMDERLKWQKLSLIRVHDFDLKMIKKQWMFLLDSLGVKK